MTQNGWVKTKYLLSTGMAWFVLLGFCITTLSLTVFWMSAGFFIAVIVIAGVNMKLLWLPAAILGGVWALFCILLPWALIEAKL